MALELWIILFLVLGLVALISGAFFGSNDHSQREAELIAEVALLRSEVEKKDLTIQDHKNRNRVLSERVEVLEARVRDLELILHGKTTRGQIDLSVLNPPLLLIASDEYFQRQDEVALNKAKMPYRRIVGATRDKIEQELRKARQQKTMYRYIVFSAHSNTSGVKLADDTYLDAYWLNQNLIGAEIVVLANCKSSDVANGLINIVPYVISMLESIPTQASQSFIEVFWTNIVDGNDVEMAFTEALGVEPGIRSYAELNIS